MVQSAHTLRLVLPKYLPSQIPISVIWGGVLDVPKEMMLAHDDIINIHQDCALPLACA